jgi:hypothetical protein
MRQDAIKETLNKRRREGLLPRGNPGGSRLRPFF